MKPRKPPGSLMIVCNLICLIIPAFTLLVGGGLLVELAHDHSMSQQAQDWVEVQADLEKVDLEVSYSSIGSREPDVICEYTYNFAGRTFTGDRISFGGSCAKRWLLYG